ncbi:MAG TPA: HAD family phosphatase [Streptosporangiaceae bacterium]|nr:HAD family phosphatase [Streptosporangiaceae bacterium]
MPDYGPASGRPVVAGPVVAGPVVAGPADGAVALQAVLFDMDGLLVNSEPLWFEAEAAIMARMGSPWGVADQEHLIGGSLLRSTAYMQSKAVHPAPQEVIARWLVEGMADLVRARGVPPMPGAAELLAEIAAAGIPHALVTSAEREIMEAALDAIGVRFPVTVCAADVVRGKPDPEPYLRAAALLGAEPGRCVALEDSPSGITSAHAAGCAVIAVPSVAPPPGLARLTVPSLRDVDLAVVHGVVAGPDGRWPMTKESLFGHNPGTTLR